MPAKLSGSLNKPADNSALIVDVGYVARLLKERGEELVRELFPDAVIELGIVTRNQSKSARMDTVKGGRGRCVCVELSGKRAGKWCDFGSAGCPEGDLLDLIALALFDGNKSRAFDWARSWLQIDELNIELGRIRYDR